MAIIDRFKNEMSDMYPVYPGFNITLGDIGYWNGAVWCPMGNIKETYGKVDFTEKTRPVNQKIEILIGAEFENQNGFNVETEGTRGEVGISFKKKDSLFFRAHLTKEIYFSSILGELKPYIGKLELEKEWNFDYWIAVSVFYSDSFVSILSREAGASVGLTLDLKANIEETCLAHGEVYSIVKKNNSTVVHLMSDDNGSEQFVGVKFVKYKKDGFFRKERTLKYAGESIDFGKDSTEEFY